ncbi:unnamed protein product [Lupinus luteus]|uniref:F-box domain-containing protein n=1 Tax=Lupinus luteus TaxID=3873 RepID=A0AAV1VQC1_LUPLU
MATIVTSIEYLVSEILLRLPVKSLLRFKCVSKQWFALISEPKFCHSHTLRLYRNSRVFPSAILLSAHNSRTCQIIPLKTNKITGSSNRHEVEVPKGTVIQSCNGLLLVERSTSQDLSEVKYYVCNPTTNKSVPVIFPTQEFRCLVVSLFICFEPLKSLHYRLVSVRFKNYKSFSDMGNVVVPTNIPRPAYVINVFSSETSSWSEPGFTFTSPNYAPPNQTNTVYFNGSLYWHSDSLWKFFYFNLDSQILKTCPTPLNIEDKGLSKFCESGGHLYFVHEPLSDSELNIMELNEEKSEWSLIFILEFCESARDPLHFYCYSIINQENDEDNMVVFIRNDDVMFYNLACSSCEVLMGFSSCLMPLRERIIYQHYENLSSVGPFST